jgi:hypothetical protein
MLIRVHGFERRDIVTLTDQRATRTAILKAIEQHLLKPATKGDVLFLYYAGHGSQVRNSLSDEPDRLDESIVPADSRLGARDIRDKELRRTFNRILDRGARLTVFLDACHSGSGARGGRTTGVRYRGVRRDERDVADGRKHGPRPEERGALVVSAAQDYDTAWERRDDEGQMHGAFSWAWIRAMRDASSHESAEETFLRAQARLRAETPFQEPVLAGNTDVRFNPFLGVSTDRRDRAVIGVERVQSDGTVLLQGGWANGLSVGSELSVLGDAARITSRLMITQILGPGKSAARIETGRTLPQDVRSGALVEIVNWATSPAIHAWQLLESPPEMRAPYCLALRRASDGELVQENVVLGEETYRLVLRAATALAANIPPRYYYVLAIDSLGRSSLAFPRGGSVENRFPIGNATPEISLGDAGSIEIQRPYGIDTFFLLTTDEPLPNPWILEKDGIRAPAVTPGTWSIEKFVYQSVAPKKVRSKTPQRVANGV